MESNLNLLKQTALVLGLMSLSIGSWTFYRNWRSRVALLFGGLCLLIAGWALSFVAHITLGGRLFLDIHGFLNLWIAPMGVGVLSRLMAREDRVSQVLFGLSFAGALVLSVIVGFTLSDHPAVQGLVLFWPSFVLVEYVYLLVQDVVLKKPMPVDFLSNSKRTWVYIGLGITLLTCTQDHIAFYGETLPAVGNLLFTAYLLFLAQLITPQQILRLESLITRFLATVVLSLVITGFFALLYQYISESFGLFLLNSFLISFAILVLWSPLVSFIRFLWNKVFPQGGVSVDQRLERFKIAITTITDLDELELLLQRFLGKFFYSSQIKLIHDFSEDQLPNLVRDYFIDARRKNDVPILSLDFIQIEREQILSVQRKSYLDLLEQYLESIQGALVFPVFHNSPQGPSVEALVVVQTSEMQPANPFQVGLYERVYQALQEVHSVLRRVERIESDRERDRLVHLGEMAAGLAHEIRNPLGAIQGAAELIGPREGQQIDPTSKAWLDVIQEEVGRLNRLVNQFLDFSHAPVEDPESVNLLALIESTIKNLKPSLPTSVEVSIHSIEPPGRNGVWVRVIPDQIQQVLINLIQNAVKASYKGDTARVEVHVFDSGFKVKDFGTGLSQSELENAFRPFFTAFSKGSGLGLAICRRLVQFNEGRISIQTELGYGTEVTVELKKDE